MDTVCAGIKVTGRCQGIIALPACQCGWLVQSIVGRADQVSALARLRASRLRKRRATNRVEKESKIVLTNW